MRATAWKLAALLAVLAALRMGAVARAEVDGDRYESAEWGVTISAPASWRMSEQTSYPNILLWMHRYSPPGRMLLSAEKLTRRITSQAYAEETQKTLEQLGFQVRKPQVHAATGAYWIEFDDGKTFLRQALLVVGDLGYSLTLSAPDSSIRNQHLRAFDHALRSIRIDRERAGTPPGAPAPPGNASAPASPTATLPAPPEAGSPAREKP